MGHTRHLDCEVRAISVSVLVSLRSVFYPAGQWVAFTPINNCAAFCIALICLDLPGQAASPRLASFGLIAHRTDSRYSLALEMRAVRISSAIIFRYTYTAPQNPCLTFNHHLSLFSVSALRPPSGVLISPPGSGTVVSIRLPPPRK